LKYNNLLVTGGAGFIGSNFIKYVLSNFEKIKIVNLDLLTYAGNLKNLEGIFSNKNYYFSKGDINNQNLVEDILEQFDIDAIVHFAAESHVDKSILDPYSFANTNILGTLSLLESCRNVWLKNDQLIKKDVKFHHISTDEVFGSLYPKDLAFSETTSYSPNSPYAASKASADHLVRAYGHTYGLPFTITNCSNNYGSYQFPEKLIPLVILNALNGKEIPIYGDGLQIRDWLYVEDHCEAIWNVLQNGENGESYNIGGDNQFPNIKIVDMICDILDEISYNENLYPRKNLKKYVKDRQGHDRRYDINSNKIHNELGWYPKYQLEKGLRKTIMWYLDNNKWVEDIVSRKNYKDWMTENYSKRESK
jgi:dTDP-glucose 4,6-dehydratase